MKRRTKEQIRKLMLTIGMSIVAVFWMMPVAAGFFTSFKSNQEVKMFSEYKNIIPRTWTLDNYQYVLNYAALPIQKLLLNSFIVCIACVVFTLVLCTLSAYAFERFDFPKKETLFWILFALSAIPNVVALVPQYSMYSSMGWINQLPSIIAPNIADVFSIYLIRQFMKGIPKELDECAKIDGANELTILRKIIVPLLTPVLTMVAIFKFSDVWNDFLWPSIAISTPDHYTITPALNLLNNAYRDTGRVERSLASCVLAMIPTLIIFIIFRKRFLEGLDITAGIKG